MFVLAGAKHEVFDGLPRILAFFKNQLHLLGDGHFNPSLAGEAESGPRRVYAFGDLAAERGQDLRKLAALTQGHADGAIARKCSSAGENEIAHAGAAGERFAAASPS